MSHVCFAAKHVVCWLDCAQRVWKSVDNLLHFTTRGLTEVEECQTSNLAGGDFGSQLCLGGWLAYQRSPRIYIYKKNIHICTYIYICIHIYMNGFLWCCIRQCGHLIIFLSKTFCTKIAQTEQANNVTFTSVLENSSDERPMIRQTSVTNCQPSCSRPC